MSTTTQANGKHVDETMLPPHNLEAEKQVISACLIDDAVIGKVKRIIGPHSFFRDVHARIFRAILEVHDQGEPVDIVTVCSKLGLDPGNGILEVRGLSADDVTDIATKAPHSLHAEHHAAIVAEASRARQLLEVLRETIKRVHAGDASVDDLAREGFVSFVSRSEGASPEFSSPPRKIVAQLRPVPAFNPKLLPVSLRAWIEDIADRMQCAPEFVAVAAVVALATVVGRKVAIRPKAEDDWTVIANLWAMVIGRPGLMKTPALEEALSQLKRLAAEAMERHEDEVRQYEQSAMVGNARRKAAKDRLEKEAKKPDTRDEVLRQLAEEASKVDEGETPIRRRYIVNDSTVPKIGELLRENPNGFLIYRDELIGLLRTLDKNGSEGDRQFYLEGWNGSNAFETDRIERGNIAVKALVWSMLGGVQPGPLAGYLRQAVAGYGDDGLVARFQLAVYPDQDRPFKVVDRKPDTGAKNRAYGVLKALDNATAERILGSSEVERQWSFDERAVPYLRFDDTAQSVFFEWLEALERKVRAEDVPALESHLAKYRSLMPTLALLFHLADRLDPEGDHYGPVGPVGIQPTKQAIAWCHFLEQHARRIYGMALEGDIQPAVTLSSRLARLPEVFTLRDVLRKNWTGLNTLESVEQALGVLEDHGWVRSVEIGPTGKGGRPTVHYHVHPVIRGEE